MRRGRATRSQSQPEAVRPPRCGRTTPAQPFYPWISVVVVLRQLVGLVVLARTARRRRERRTVARVETAAAVQRAVLVEAGAVVVQLARTAVPAALVRTEVSAATAQLRMRKPAGVGAVAAMADRRRWAVGESITAQQTQAAMVVTAAQAIVVLVVVLIHLAIIRATPSWGQLELLVTALVVVGPAVRTLAAAQAVLAAQVLRTRPQRHGATQRTDRAAVVEVPVRRMAASTLARVVPAALTLVVAAVRAPRAARTARRAAVGRDWWC